MTTREDQGVELELFWRGKAPCRIIRPKLWLHSLTVMYVRVNAGIGLGDAFLECAAWPTLMQDMPSSFCCQRRGRDILAGARLNRSLCPPLLLQGF